MDSNLYISALQWQPCLLKTNSTRVLVTWLITSLLIICPSSYKAPPDNLIGTADIEPQIISSQWSNARPNFPTKNFVGGAKFGLVSRLDVRGNTDKINTKSIDGSQWRMMAPCLLWSDKECHCHLLN